MRAETARWLAGRFATSCLVVLVAMLLLFALVSLVPGDPATALFGPQASPEFARRFVAAMGLDQPLHVRFWRFLSRLATGDLGVDVLSGRPVAGMIGAVLPSTIVLTASAIGLAVLVGVPLGIFSALHRGSVADTVLAFVSVAFIAIPSFVVAILLLLVFSIWLDWLPVLGTARDGDWLDSLRRLILPSVALALGWVGFLSRMVRASMLEVLAEPHIRTARAYGLPGRIVVWRYALKNAAIPTVAILGFGIGRLLGGAVLVEIVFARPGIGRLLYDAILVRNFPVVQGTVFVVVVLFVAVNLLADLSYAALDPRIRRAA